MEYKFYLFIINFIYLFIKPNPGMMQQHNNLVQQPTQPNQPGVQQQQQRVNMGQQPPQQYPNY